MPALKQFNALPSTDAETALRKCCGSTAWIKQMMAARPFASESTLFQAAQSIWSHLSSVDFLEAFSHHPRIGDRVRAGGWESREQAGTQSASESTLDELKRLNALYEEKFGHVFLICATGKSAEEMLTHLRTRLTHAAEVELKNAAHEQGLITQLRLQKMLDELKASGD